MRGEVVGINTSGFSSAIKNLMSTEPSLDVVQGMFARASRTCEPFARMIARDKKVRRASLGLRKVKTFSHLISFSNAVSGILGAQ